VTSGVRIRRQVSLQVAIHRPRGAVVELEVVAHLHDIVLADLASGDYLVDEAVVVLLSVAEGLRSRSGRVRWGLGHRR